MSSSIESGPELTPEAGPAASRSRRSKGRPIMYATAAVSAIAMTLLITQLNAGDAEESTAAAAAPAVSVTVAAPLVETITEWDEYTGRFVAGESVEIRSRVSGYLTEVAFEDGQTVEKGDLLFRIDPRPFEAVLAAARADLAHAEAALENARAEQQRGERLVARQALSTEEAERRTRALDEAEADRAAALARVNEAELDLEFTRIRAPITGRISDDFVSEGNLINGGAQGGTLLTTLVSLDPIQFEFTTSEADYLRYRRLEQDGTLATRRGSGHPVFVKLMDETAFATEGTLSFLDNQLDSSTGNMRARATFENSDGLFTPGMFGRVRLAGSGEYPAVMIPDAAVQTDQTQKFVWVASESQTAERRNIVSGPLVKGLRVVRSGLTGEDNLVVSGTQFIQQGSELAAHHSGTVNFAELQPDPEGRQ